MTDTSKDARRGTHDVYFHPTFSEDVLARGLFDVEFYKGQLPRGWRTRNLSYYLKHYMTVGEAKGLLPNPKFNPQIYLRINPDVAANNLSPLSHYIEYGKAEGRAASLDEEVPSAEAVMPQDTSVALSDHQASSIIALELSDHEKAKAIIHESGVFDVQFYCRNAGVEMDEDAAIDHYLNQGEALKYAPSPKFSPRFYRAYYRDVDDARISPLLHYLRFGKAEGRRGTILNEGDVSALCNLPAEKEAVLLIVHETSMTGAPILGLNICRYLKSHLNYMVVALSWRGAGPLAPAFRMSSDLFLEPDSNGHFEAYVLKEIISVLKETLNIKYAIANSLVVNKIAVLAKDAGILVVGLIHEFSALSGAEPSVGEYLRKVDELVFPAEVVKQSLVLDHPSLKYRHTNVIAQGRSIVDGLGPSLRRRDRPLGIDYQVIAVLKWAAADDHFVVAGMGTLEWRKGIDLFISTAQALKQKNISRKVKFVWIGDYHSGSYEASLYAEEQIERGKLQDYVIFLPGTARINEVYKLIDVLLVIPRLDPLPNVAIDAMSEGLPVVACEGGTGVTEVLARDPVLSELIVPYMDVNTAARVIERLALDSDFVADCKLRIKALASDTFDMRDYVQKIDRLMRVGADSVDVDESVV